MVRKLIAENKIELAWFSYVLLLLLLHNGSISLWDQDEAAYAGFASNMVNANNWLIPDFIWGEIHRKPPLHFWGIAISYQIFGVNEFSTRLTSSLAIFSLLLLVFFQVKAMCDKKTALLSSIVLGTSFLVPALGKMAFTDGLLLLLTSICGFSVMGLLRTKKITWVIGFWIAFALALLTKGPPIVIFSSGFIGLLAVCHPNRKTLLKLHPWFFLPLACLPLFLWGYGIVQAGGADFIDWMLDWYIFNRVSGSVLGQTAPPGFHLLAMVLFFLPYFIFLPLAIKNGMVGLFRKHKKIVAFGAWFIAGWLIYEFSPSKLPAYAVAAHVPLAILIALQMQKNDKPNKVVFSLHFTLTSMLFAGLVVAPFFLLVTTQLKLTAIVLGVVLLTANGLAYLYFRKKGEILSIIVVALLFQLGAWGLLTPQFDELKNATKRTAQFISKQASAETQVVISNKFAKPPSLPFYLKQHFNHVSEEYDLVKLKAIYSSQQPAALILSRELAESFKVWKPQIEITEFSSVATDRKQRMNYYVVFNQRKRIFDK